MVFPNRYKIMSNILYSIGVYSLVPIRYEDRLDIMKWRNEQIFHLRQKKMLTEEQQNKYFQEVVADLFEQDYPEQILFSYLENEKCIGYGGLVHIDWHNKNAEISFIMDSSLEKDYFSLHWKIYLSLLENYAFKELNLHKIYTYAFDIRSNLYTALEEGGLIYEARLKKHVLFESEFKDIVIHSKFNPIILKYNDFYLRNTNLEDAEILFHWANDTSVRRNSFNSEKIEWESHLKWLKSKLGTNDSHMYILHNSAIECPIGQIRLDYSLEFCAWNIGYSINKFYRGMGLSTIILELIKDKHRSLKLHAEVKPENIASIKTFMKTGFKKISEKDNVVIFEYTD